MIPLGLLGNSEIGEITEIRMTGTLQPGQCREGACEGNPACSGTCKGGGHCQRERVSRIEEMGIRVGKSVEMLNNGGGDPLLVKVDESRIAMGRGMAMKIIVRREKS